MPMRSRHDRHGFEFPNRNFAQALCGATKFASRLVGEILVGTSSKLYPPLTLVVWYKLINAVYHIDYEPAQERL